MYPTDPRTVFVLVKLFPSLKITVFDKPKSDIFAWKSSSINTFELKHSVCARGLRFNF